MTTSLVPMEQQVQSYTEPIAERRSEECSAMRLAKASRDKKAV